jgi:malonate decarboxylase epsilon subunit
VAEDLANNIANGVRWHDSISLLEELGTDIFVELNPGNVLSRLGAESFPHLRFIALEDSSPAYVSRLPPQYSDSEGRTHS